MAKPKTEMFQGQIPTHIREVRITAPGTANEIARLALPLMAQFQEGEEVELVLKMIRRGNKVTVAETITFKR
jgi:hypothetical protein